MLMFVAYVAAGDWFRERFSEQVVDQMTCVKEKGSFLKEVAD